MGLIMQNGISYGGADIVKLTQTEYDALPESKYSDGILYAITDGEGSSGGTSKPVELTKAQYEALGESTKTDGILYAITDGDELSAKNLEYDGSVTGLGNNVQDAIDGLNSNLTSKMLTYNPETDWFGFYVDGVWKDVIKGYANETLLYSPGKEYETITGGWYEYVAAPRAGEPDSYNTDKATAANSFTKSNDYIRLYHTSDGSSCVMTKNYINLRNATTLEMETKCDYNSCCSIGVADSHEHGFTALASAVARNTTKSVVTIDVSNIDGGYIYIRNRLYNAQYGNKWASYLYNVRVY